MANKENTLVLIKPDGIAKSLTGNIITTLSDTGVRIVGAKMVKVPQELAEIHYAEHKDKPFFKEVVEYLMGKHHKGDDQDRGRVLALVYNGENVVERVRNKCGKTHPEEAASTSIRGKYGRVISKTGVFENVVHTSDSKENAEREIKLWFNPHELAEEIFPTKAKQENVEQAVWK